MESCRREPCEGGEAPRFLADAMLGRLARWLRILGYDAEYFPGEDDDLLRLARRERRVLLTRDTRLLRRRSAGVRPPLADTDPLPPHLFIQSDHVMEQLRQVVAALRLDPTVPPARRCACCNAVIEPRTKAEVFGLVPEFVWSHHETFWACPGCQRIYWAGTHRQRMEEAIRTLCA